MARHGYKVKQFTKTVASAGTAEPLSATDLFSYSIEIAALDTNTGKVYVGDSDVDSTTAAGLDAGKAITMSGPLINGNQYEIRVDQIYVDAATNGEGVSITYLAKPDA